MEVKTYTVKYRCSNCYNMYNADINYGVVADIKNVFCNACGCHKGVKIKTPDVEWRSDVE